MESIPPTENRRFDLFFAIVSSLVAIGVALWSIDVPPAVELASGESMNKWFGADINRVMNAETDPSSPAHYRNNVHPFFSLLTLPFVVGIMRLGGLEPLAASVWFHCGLAGLLGALLYQVIVREVEGRLAALTLTIAALSTASFVFWAGVVETRVPSAITVAIVLLAHPRIRSSATLGWVTVTLVAFSMLITNVTVAGISMLQRLPLRRVALLGVLSVMAALPLSLAQRALFPQSELFFKDLKREGGYVQLTRRSPDEVARKIVRRATVITASTVLLPGVEHAQSPNGGLRTVTDRSLMEVGPGPVFVVGLGAWVLLVGLGLAEWWRERDFRSVASLGVGFCAAQFALHLVYGDETFLFVLTALPALMVIVARAFVGRFRVGALVLAIVAAACGFGHNLTLLETARAGMLPLG